MIRDQGPRHNLGFGVSSNDLPPMAGDEREGVNPESGVIAKALHDHPVMRFFAASAATLVAMHVAGQVVRKGGLKLIYEAERKAPEWVGREATGFRHLQKFLDEYQGVTRTLLEGNEEGRLVVRDARGRLRSGDNAEQLQGFFFTRGEKERARKLGLPDTTVPEWTYRREMQQRLISQARRLPYELPAAYAAQRGVIDPLFGSGDNTKVDWTNPVDVLTDFVSQSSRNIISMVGPFEAGSALGTQSWRRFMTYGDGLVNMTAGQQTIQSASLTLKTILSRVGADSAEVLNKALRYTSQSTGAFSTGVHEANLTQTGLVSHLYRIRNSAAVARREATEKNISGFRNLWMQGRSILGQEVGNVPDALPGPLRGLKTGFTAGKTKWQELGNAHDSYEKLLGLGRKRFEEAARTGSHGVTKDDLENVKNILSGGSPIEELASEAFRLRGGPVAEGLSDRGTFWRERQQEEYHKLVERALKKRGVSEQNARRFVTQGTINIPHGDPLQNYMDRIQFGKGVIQAPNDLEWERSLAQRLRGFGSDGNAIAHNIKGAVNTADDVFAGKLYSQRLNAKINEQWDLVENRALPEFTSRLLPHRREAYEKFTGKSAGSPEHQFLLRKSAAVSGIDLTDASGRRVSDAAVSARLRSRGFNPSNTEQLRAYLVGKKAIAKPWTYGGRNLLGLRPMTVSQTLSSGYFPSDVASNIDSLTGALGRHDPVSMTPGMNLFRMPGMYETSGGRIIDFSGIRKRGRRFADRIMREVQIPLIHIKPFETMGLVAARESARRPLLQYVSGMSNQAFLGRGEETLKNDFYLWMRENKGKGRVLGFRSGTNGSSMHELPGLFRTQGTGAYGMVGRAMRLGAGDTGIVPQDVPDNRVNRLRKKFNVDQNQPDSAFRFLDRFKKRQTDIRNPAVFFNLMRDGTVGRGRRAKALSDFGEQELADAFENAQISLRSSSLPTKMVRNIQNNPKYAHLFKLDFGSGVKPRHFTAGARIEDLTTPAAIDEARQLTLNRSEEIARWLDDANEPGSTASSLRNAQSLLRRHKNLGPESWDLEVPRAARSSNVYSKIDQAKADLIKFNIIEEGLIQGRSFSSIIADFQGEAGTLRSAGKLTSSEYSEFQTALLGMQLNYQNFAHYDRTASSFTRNMQAIARLRSDPANADLFTAASSGKSSADSGLMGYIMPAVRRRFKTSANDFDTVGYNPWGRRGSDTVLLPTFGTAAARNPRAAAASVLGLNTWSNPDSFSGASVISSHLISRLNRPLSIVGLGLDESAFRGPLDMYARGLIGQRALPLVVGGTLALTADRTLGGALNPKDDYGNRVYSPYLLGHAARGVVEARAAISGITPGGMTYEEKKDQLLEGEVPIRAGRYWPLGSTPFKGGRIQYFRPSWYQRLKGGAQYTDQTYGSPLERLAFGYDFSPLRPLDPYRFEREHYSDRPYPVTGEYFTGPWGPLTTALNATVGKVLKPQRKMHEEAVAYGLASYQPVGTGGAYLPQDFSPGYTDSGYDVGGGSLGGNGGGAGGGYAAGITTGAISGGNAALGQQGRAPLGAATNISHAVQSGQNANLSAAASFGIPNQAINGIPPRIIGAGDPNTTQSAAYQAGKFGYESQELLGIYGFAFGALRDRFGFGTQDYTSHRPTLASASQAYGATRGFWDLNLGGLGDVPSPFEGNYANLEFSEIARRFIPKERKGTNFLNPIPNELGAMYPWLPGSDYITNFRTGDPFTSIQEGELRLPGEGYERLHHLHPDATGKYGIVDRHKILGDVAPWSQQYKDIDRQIESLLPSLPSQWQDQVATTREQVQAKAVREEFSPYDYKYQDMPGTPGGDVGLWLKRKWENFEHADTYLNTKFLPHRTALEDWERENVYGSTFPTWQSPIESYIKPTLYSASQRNPLYAAGVLGVVGGLFVSNPRTKAVGAVIGGLIGAGASIGVNISEAVTGQRYIPKERKKQLALEEYTDILTYTRNMALYNQSKRAGEEGQARMYRQAAQRTMYGADVQLINQAYTPEQRDRAISQLAAGIPKRKRDHFRAFIDAPVEEREQILSTAGRLERRIYESAWGMNVEARPDLGEYFQEHELPDPSWEGWHPNTNMEQVKIKVGQNMGIDMSQMGYYPQQIAEANYVNSSYPSFSTKASGRNVRNRIRALMDGAGISGDVIPVYTPYGGNRVQLNASVY